jgi:hypothetical protein
MQSGSTLNIDAPAVFKPPEQPSRYKGLQGGGDSGQELARMCCAVYESPVFGWSVRLGKHRSGANMNSSGRPEQEALC